MNACLEPKSGKLVDLAFLRAMSARERQRLEKHLSGCGACVERYERLWTAERMLHAGGGIESPSTFEIERMEVALGLSTPARRISPEWWLGFAVIAALFLAFVLVRAPSSEDLTPRGASAAGWSVAAFAVDPEGRVRRLGPHGVVWVGESLKMTLGGGQGQVRILALFGALRLDVPWTGEPSVPGSIVVQPPAGERSLDVRIDGIRVFELPLEVRER